MSDPTRRDVLRSAAAAAVGIAVADLLPERAIAQSTPTTAPASPLTLWYRQPAKEWTEALPLGNGRLGAMVFGGVARERLQLNEDTLYAGGPYDPINPLARDALPEARKLIFAGKEKEAVELISDRVMARPLKQMPYQAVGDLFLDFSGTGDSTDYRRELDLARAVTTTTFTRVGVRFTREAFISPIDQVIVVNLTADRPGAIAFAASFASPHAVHDVKTTGDDTLILAGRNGTVAGVEGKLTFEARLRITTTNGACVPKDDALHVSGADAARLTLAIGTNYVAFDDVNGDASAVTLRGFDDAVGKPLAAMRDETIAAHRALFDRVTLDLGTTPAADRPTDERVRASATADDPALAALYFNYARYLLIACSRAGSQPANLQGIWAEGLDPPWGSKFTININTEMNYWPAEPTNLGECVEPLVRMVTELAERGTRVAREMYGAGGWVCHHNTDGWRAAAPIDGPNWGMWPTGGAWLCKHLSDRYDFGRDRAYLARVYPVLKGAAQFFVDTLVPEPTHGWLVTCPSISPEHEHHPGVAVCAGPTMDQQIVRDLFDNVARAAETLAIDADFAAQVRATRAKLAPTQVGPQGQLQEWLDGSWDATAPDPKHRHISHCYGLFPSDQIDVRTTPALADAARATLNTRGDVTTGWAIAWRINCWARLHDGERAHSILKLLLDPSRTYPNLFDAHPPFQIDGNFGGANGVVEMLMQSPRTGEIELLPALPKAWPTGRITGLRARGGFGVDVAWSDGALATATIHSTAGLPLAIRYGDRVVRPSLNAGEAITVDRSLSS